MYILYDWNHPAIVQRRHPLVIGTNWSSTIKDQYQQKNSFIYIISPLMTVTKRPLMALCTTVNGSYQVFEGVHRAINDRYQMVIDV
ncbi:hypothetical protein KEM48_008167 [Puccinia striiformis f. sp. tritici PST-130]|nr:hypothetical protein KEM48_008167 [Puccinia striiformis f. sp. tritici PST-130]